MRSTGILWILEDFGVFIEMCSRVSRLNFKRKSSLKGIPLDWALANAFEDFLSHNYCEQKQTAHSEIYQRHRHLNLPLDKKLHLLPQKHQWNKSHVIFSRSLISTANSMARNDIASLPRPFRDFWFSFYKCNCHFSLKRIRPTVHRPSKLFSTLTVDTFC